MIAVCYYSYTLKKRPISNADKQVVTPSKPQVSTSIHIDDGSLNIFAQEILTEKLQPIPDLNSEWRKKYLTIIPERANSQSIGLMVFPLYDASVEGVGYNVLESWQALLNGLLAERTNARLFGNLI